VLKRHFTYLRRLMTKIAGDFAAKLYAGDNLDASIKAG
jgi:hypothetical protein